MIEKLFGLEKATIQQCQELARKCSVHNMDCTFDLCGPLGTKKAKWVDPYLGFFELEGHKGLFPVRELVFAPNLWCENVMPAEKEH